MNNSVISYDAYGKKYYVRRDHWQHGPLSEHNVVEACTNRILIATDLISDSESNNWIPLNIHAKFSNLFFANHLQPFSEKINIANIVYSRTEREVIVEKSISKRDQAYETIKNKNLLFGSRFTMYQIIYRAVKIGLNELLDQYYMRTDMSNLSKKERSGYKCLTNLQEWDLVRVCGKTMNKDTGEIEDMYETTGELPDFGTEITYL